MRLITENRSVREDMDRSLKSLENDPVKLPVAFEISRMEANVLWREMQEEYPINYAEFMMRLEHSEIFYNDIPIRLKEDTGLL